jgi:hypothetical protein
VKDFLRRRLRYTAFRKGVVGSSGVWLTIWVLFVGGRIVRRVFGRYPTTVYRATLEPGQSLVIAHGRETGAIQVPE